LGLGRVLDLVVIAGQPVLLGLVGLCYPGLFLGALRRHAAHSEADQVLVQPRLRRRKLRIQIALERLELGRFCRRFLFELNFLFQLGVRFELGGDLVLVGQERFLVSGQRLFRLDVGQLLLPGHQCFCLVAQGGGLPVLVADQRGLGL